MSVLFLRAKSVLNCVVVKLGLVKCLIYFLLLWVRNFPADELAVALQISLIEFSVFWESCEVEGVKVLGRRKGSRLAYSGGSEFCL